MSGRSSVLTPARERASRDANRDAFRKHGAMLKRWVTRMARNGKQQRVEESVQLVQDPAVYAAASNAPQGHTEAGAARAAFWFVTSDSDGTKREADAVGDLLTACNTPEYAALVSNVLLKAYVLEPVPYVPTSSFVAPTLRWATTNDSEVRLFIDNARRVVVKAYPLASILQKYAARAAKDRDTRPLVDLATDIVVSYYLGTLIRDYERVVTPHFTYVVDYFAGPMIDGDALTVSRATPNSKAVVTSVQFVRNSLAQYVAVERADLTLSALFEREGLTLQMLRAVLFPSLFSLEAGWLLAAYLHYDFHGGNLMAKLLANEIDSPFLNRVWAYKRAGHAEYYYLTVAEHGNVFAEIIDAGRSRMLVPADEGAGPRGAKRLVGNPMFEAYGIFVDGARADRSWDVRRIAFDLLLGVDPDALVARAATGRPPTGDAHLARTDTALATLYKDMIITALGGGRAFTSAIIEAARKRVPLSSARSGNSEAEQQRAFIDTFWTALVAEASALRPRGRARPPSDVKVFDSLAPIFRAAARATGYSASTFFEQVIDPLFIAQNAAGANGSDLSVTTLLDHGFFDALRGSNQTDEVRASALLVGFVKDEDVLADPRADGVVASDVMDIGAPVSLQCKVCGTRALGQDTHTRASYCGVDCMMAALNPLNA